jgi:hypothetical protein
MTTSGPAGEPTGRHGADPEPIPVTGLAGPAPDDGAPQTALPADAETRPSDDLEELQQDIEQTRERLGETVDQLVARADIKGRTRHKVSELAGRAKGKASQARAQATDGTVSVRDQVAGNARQRRVPLTVAAAALIVGYLVVRRWRKR